MISIPIFVFLHYTNGLNVKIRSVIQCTKIIIFDVPY